MAFALAVSVGGCGRVADENAATEGGGAEGSVGGLDADAQAGGARSRHENPVLSVTVSAPRLERWPVSVAADGHVHAWQDVVVGSELSGQRLADVMVNVGDTVKQGDLLARIATATFEAERAQIAASVAEAQAALAEARANVERSERLAESGMVSAQQLTQQRTAERTALARLNAQRARLSGGELHVSQSRVLSPVDGVVSARNAMPGAIVQPGAELFRLIRDGRLEWRAEMGADDLARIRPGMPATIHGPDHQRISGTVRIVAPTVDPRTLTGIVYVDLPPDSPLRAGMFARGSVELGQAEALTLPASAVELRDGFSQVWLLDADNHVHAVRVQTGRRVGDRVEIVAGTLAPDARVVESGSAFLGNGDLVRVVQHPAQ